MSLVHDRQENGKRSRSSSSSVKRRKKKRFVAEQGILNELKKQRTLLM